MNYEESAFLTSDGLELFSCLWRPEADPRAVVALVHGLGEHRGRYRHLAEFLCRQGIALAAYDLRGHGKSLGPRGHSPSYQILMEDIRRFLDTVSTRLPGSPAFLYGHSLGGNLVINYALRCQPALAGVIASGPALRVASEPPAAMMAFASVLARIAPATLMANGLDRSGLSRLDEVVQVYSRDPLVHDRISVRLALDLFSSGAWALEHAADFPLPLLLMHGSADRLTSAAASQEFADHLGTQVTLRLWQDFYHEIHNEPEQLDVFHYLLTWLDARLAATN